MNLIDRFFRVFMPKSELYVFGSSILWGQGHRPIRKIGVRTAKCIEKRFWEKVRTRGYAHSGALLSGDDEQRHVRLHGEVPSPWPSVLAQIRRAPEARTKRVRILIEGGINEVGGARIASPATSTSYIESATKTACHTLMKEVLGELSRKFPRAEIYVLGYYQILANRADEKEVGGFLEKDGMRSEGGEDDGIDFVEKAIENTQRFRCLSDRFLRQAAEEVNEIHEGPCVFVPSGISEKEGMFGDTSLLFHPWSQDDMFRLRARYCTSALRKGRTGVHCYLASTAHPNEMGVGRYVASIEKAMFDGSRKIR